MIGKAAILKMIGSPDMASRRWVWEQYDHLIQSNSAQIPGGDAAVVRVNDDGKAIAICTDVTPRYVEADPYRGRQAGGRRSLAQPRRGGRATACRYRQSQFRQSGTARNHGPARHGNAKALAKPAARCHFPIVSGNVSLYNETNGRRSCRRRPSAVSGLLPDCHKWQRIAFKREGDAILLLGGHGTHLGQSIYLREMLGREERRRRRRSIWPEKRNGDFVRAN